MVMIAGEKAGYISREENVKVRRILKEKDIVYISAFVGGGEYKELQGNGSFEKFDKPMSITVRIAYK